MSGGTLFPGGQPFLRHRYTFGTLFATKIVPGGTILVAKSVSGGTIFARYNFCVTGYARLICTNIIMTYMYTHMCIGYVP